jgi:hypothetical protein
MRQCRAKQADLSAAMREVASRPREARYDDLYEDWVVPISCPCCVKCWLVVECSHKGRVHLGKCVHGGPYKGYIEVE